MSWTSDLLSELATTIDYGLTASASSESRGPKFLRITDIQNGKVDWDSVPFCEASEKERTRFALAPKDIVFARTGATTGKSFLIDQCPTDAVFASYLIRVRPSDRLDARFLAHYFQTNGYWKQIASRSSGTAQGGVNASKLANLRIPVPPLEEQRRIAEVLDRADALRQKRRLALQKLDTLLQSVFLDMFGDPVTNPKGWELKYGDDLAKRLTVGIVVKPASYYVENGIPALRSLNVRPNRFELDDLVYFSERDNETRLTKTRVWKDDIVLVRSGQPGTAAVVPESLNGVNAIDLLILTPRAQVSNPIYLCHYFNSAGGRQLVLGKQRGQIQKHLNVGALKQSLIPHPPLALQNRFAAIATQLDGIKVVHRTHLVKLGALFASLQLQGFRGDLFCHRSQTEDPRLWQQTSHS